MYEVAEHLRMGSRTVRELTKRGVLRSYRILEKKGELWDLNEVDDLVRASRITPVLQDSAG